MKQLLIGGLGLLVLILTACNLSTPDINPSPEVLLSETPTLEASALPSPSLTPSVTPTLEVNDVPVIVASPLPTRDAFVPNPDVIPTATQGACEVTILDNEALIGALLRVPCGNEVNFGLVDAVVAFNENITNSDFVSPGLTFFVPLPSPTPIPEGANMTETASAEIDSITFGNIRFPANQEFGDYTVEEGDNIVGIAELYNTTLEVLSPLNQNLGWGGCDFTNPSGGPSCNPNLRIGDVIRVPLPTSTPVPTVTPSGRETITPTPTQESARVISPPEGSTVNQQITLEWVSVGILDEGETYLIDVEDRTLGTSTAYETRNTRYILPVSLIPSDGQTHSIAWRVRVARANEDGTYSVIGGTGNWNTFQWQSR